ncbi:DUF5689 domain-containing protein [Persicobacter sp. CCB-QB2]|uniref:DUF5689 domain-containing protein n=1 Tax=Persicobacter sp. CCB-QB2 TaxID=1561025 RepID=UPI0006A9CBD3|nr:DUF5689 domain-containing protein [Persicobacter sp. CCB-QB2]
MKNLSNLYRALLPMVVMALLFSACKKDDPLGPTIPEGPEVEVTHTLKQLKEIYTKAGSPAMYDIEEEIIVGGKVISSDENGNIYKEIYIQDESTGIIVRLDKSELYKSYAIGQMVYVKAEGMQMGSYGGMIQLGGVYNGEFGRLDADLIADHIIAGKQEEAVMPMAIDLDALPSDLDDHLATWVKVENVMFSEEDYEKTWVDADASSSQNRTLTNANGETIIVRTSNFATFGADALPQGSGSVSGILSSFNGTLQLYVNEAADAALEGDRFDDPNAVAPPAGTGTLADPFNIGAARANLDAEEMNWVKGYIVGSVPGKNLSDFQPGVTGANASYTNVAIADNSDETNPSKIFVVKISGFLQDDLNLQDNEDMLNQQVWFYGSVEKYFGEPGMRDAEKYSLDGQVEISAPTFQGQLDEIMGTDLTATAIDFNTFNVVASQSFWSASNGSAYINGHQKGAHESWMISSTTIDIAALTDPVLAVTEELNFFKGLDKVMVLGSTDYTGTGDPSVATWTELTVKGDRAEGGQSMTQFELEANIYVAFKYTCTDDEASSWSVITVEAKEYEGDNGGGDTDEVIFISEYVEGSSNNKAIELYNASAEEVDLSTYSLQIYFNGNTDPGSPIQLSGTIPAGGVYIVAHSQASFANEDYVDMTSGSLTFNGNDPVSLVKGSVMIDLFGPIGDDSNFAKDLTFRRKTSIMEGNTTFSFDDWDEFPKDTFDGLGSHSVNQ